MNENQIRSYAKKYCSGCKAYESRIDISPLSLVCSQLTLQVKEETPQPTCPCQTCLVKMKCSHFCVLFHDKFFKFCKK
jgi:hypothetical protein